MTQETTNQRLPNRWLLAGGGVLMQLALGAVYAWSVFRIPLSKKFGWSIEDVTWAFSLAILATDVSDPRRGLFYDGSAGRIYHAEPA